MELAVPVVASLLPKLLWESCNDPNIIAPKWACLHVMVAFASSPVVMRPRGFVDYLCAHHDQDCLGVGRGGDNQQQHILIVAFYPWNLEVYLHKSEVWDGCNPHFL